MFRLIAITLVALYAVFTVLGDEDRRVARTEADRAPLVSFSLAAFAPSDPEPEPKGTGEWDGLSETAAVDMALEAGRLYRENRGAALRGGTTDPVSEPGPVTASTAAAEFRVVTGERVNLRAGPGTENPVVAQLPRGTRTEVLSDPGDGWVEVSTAEGAERGWISARFLGKGAGG